jgi:hypothetical protein
MAEEMRSPHLRVAVQILRSDFGPVVEQVGTHLLEHDSCSLQQLQATQLTPTQVLMLP